jgi:hypothetical protein
MEICEECRLALTTAPRGRFPLCLKGDDLVMEMHRSWYRRHMAMVRARKEHYRTSTDPHQAPFPTAFRG